VREGDWILVKGSRQTKMEESVRKIIELFGMEEG
jgi:UDP-N-acetylmuramyl pentapeptide synthase